MNPSRLAAYATARNLRYGWRTRSVPWVLDLTDPDAPRFSAHGRTETVPYARRSGTGAAPRPGCDSVDYLTGRHRGAWTALLADFAAGCDGRAARAVRAALDTGALGRLEPPPSAKPSDLVVLRAGGHLLHHDPEIADFWQARLRAGLDSGTRGVCLSCGTTAPLARLIPAYLPSAAFGQSSAGDMALYPAGNGRGGVMGACLDCACALGAALPALAYDPEHHHLTRDGRLLLWWSPDAAEVLPVGRLLAHPDPAELESAPDQGHLCAMLLQPNTGRIGLGWFLDEPARAVADRIRRWYDAIGVYDGWTDTTYMPGIPHMHSRLGKWQPATRTYQTPSPTAPESGLWTAALSGHRPRQYGLAALTATRRDNRVCKGRTALLQLWPGVPETPAP